MVSMFQEGGWPMYVILLVDICASLFVPLALIVTLVARFTGKGRTVALVLGTLAVIVAIVPMCAGAGGYFLGMSYVEEAVAHADPEYKQVLMNAGEAEASNNLTFGFGSGCCLLLPAVFALLLVPPKPVVYDDMG
jgi:hypothetical protein